MRLVLLGAPGSGKGVQAKLLQEKLGIPQISTGDMFRASIASGDPLGQDLKGYLDAGELVPDSVTNDVVKARLTQPDAKAGFILDGYPRSVAQAEFLDNVLQSVDAPIQVAVCIDINPEKVVARITNRRMDKETGAVYNLLTSPPPPGCEVYQRADDKEETVRHRLTVYEQQTAPVIGYYEQQGVLQRVLGDQSIDDVNIAILGILGER
jgi:adenylate kinase